MKDASGNFVRLGEEFSVLTDTSDEEDEHITERDDCRRKLLESVPGDAIPTTVAVPVQIGNGLVNPKGVMENRRQTRPARPGTIKKKVRAL